MSRFRTHWLALFGGATLIALSLSTALGAKPDAGENRGQQVSAFVHSLQGDVEETDEQGDEDTEGTDEDAEVEDETDTDTETEDDAEVEVEVVTGSDHGACVAEHARSGEMGGDNNNHGGAVSQWARFDCWDPQAADEGATDEEGATDDSEESAADETETSATEHGKGHAKAHAKGHSKHN
jgi:hypothetical protein